MSIDLPRALAAAALLALASCCPPPPSYDCSCTVVKKRDALYGQLIKLLPQEERSSAEAQAEAKWLADTSQMAAAAIARVNDSCYPNWAGNILINMNMQDRGLCWHYQHDMHRELRRRKLKYFRLGTCVRDAKHAREHNCNYIAAINGAWPDAIMLDAWLGNGRLSMTPAWELSQKRWKDSPEMLAYLNSVFFEEHSFEIETWAQIKSNDGKYVSFWTNEGRRSEQYHRMYQSILRGREERNGRLTSYDR